MFQYHVSNTSASVYCNFSRLIAIIQKPAKKGKDEKTFVIGLKKLEGYQPPARYCISGTPKEKGGGPQTFACFFAVVYGVWLQVISLCNTSVGRDVLEKSL